MASGAESSSGSEYLPGDSDSEVHSEFSGDSEEEDWDAEVGREDPLSEEGWDILANFDLDQRPDDIPVFDGGDPNGSVRQEVPEFAHPVDAFCYFFDEDLVQQLCDWTNERAEGYFADTQKRKVNGLLWRDVTKDEMYVFLALVMIQGIVKMPRTYMYWSHNATTGGPSVFCGDVMSRGRFLSITKFLRFSSMTDVDKSHPRTRMEPYLDLLRQRSQRPLVPGIDIAIDEALVLWKGRLQFKQFIRTKRARFGIKAFVLSPSASLWSGYSWNFEVYYGKDTDISFDDPNASHLSISEIIVCHLMKDLLDSGRQVVTDNWYTSVRLANYLLTRNTMLTGVIWAGRGPPRP